MRLFNNPLLTILALLAAAATVSAQTVSTSISSDNINEFTTVSGNTVPGFALSQSGMELPIPVVSTLTLNSTGSASIGMGSLDFELSASASDSDSTPQGNTLLSLQHSATDSLSFNNASNLDVVLRFTPTVTLSTSVPATSNTYAEIEGFVNVATTVLDDPLQKWIYRTSTQPGYTENIQTTDIAVTLTPGASINFTTGLNAQLSLDLAVADGSSSISGLIDAAFSWSVISLSDPGVVATSLSGWDYISLSAVPEPSSYPALLGLSALAWAANRRRRSDHLRA